MIAELVPAITEVLAGRVTAELIPLPIAAFGVTNVERPKGAGFDRND